jgi:hypothetical protein
MPESKNALAGSSSGDNAAVRCEPADAATLSLILSGR